MNSSSAISNGLFFKLSMSLTTKRTKRLVYLSSLLAAVKNTQSLDKDTMHRLNAILGLANVDITSLKLPVLLSGMIWCNKHLFKDQFEALKNVAISGDIDKVTINEMISSSPNWIRYADNDKMLNDVLNMFNREHSLVE